jgi:hypothetical protein
MSGPRRPQKTYAHYKINRSCRFGPRWRGAAAPSASTPPSAKPDRASNSNTVGGSPLRRTTSAPRPGHQPPGSPPGVRLEQTARPVAPKPQPAVPRGHQPGSWPRQLDSGAGPPVDGPVRLWPTKSSFRADSVKGKCALGPFLSILVSECQHKCLNVNLYPWMDKVQIKSKGMFLSLSTLF